MPARHRGDAPWAVPPVLFWYVTCNLAVLAASAVLVEGGVVVGALLVGGTAGLIAWWNYRAAGRQPCALAVQPVVLVVALCAALSAHALWSVHQAPPWYWAMCAGAVIATSVILEASLGIAKPVRVPAEVRSRR